MKLFTRFLCALLPLAVLASEGSAVQKGDLSVEIQVRHDRIGCMEPLALLLSVSNRTIHSVQKLPSFRRAEIDIQYRPLGSNLWKSVHAPYYYLSDFFGEESFPDPQPTISIEAASVAMAEYWITFDMRLSAMEGRSHYLFNPPGVYEIRALYDPGLGFALESNTIDVESVEYTGPDKRAGEWLRSHPYSHFLFQKAGGSRCIPAGQGLRIAHQIVDQFPDSCFYPWARLYLIRFAETGAADGAELQRLRSEVDRLVEMDVPLLSAEALRQKKRIEKRQRRLSQ